MESFMTRLFKNTSSIAIAVSVAFAVPMIAMAQTASTSTTPTASTSTTATTKKDFPIRIKMADEKVTAKIVELDLPNRLATFRTANNDFVTVRVPRSVHNFDHVKVGDDLVVHYTVAAAARINPATKDGIRERVESTSTSTAKPGGMPGMVTQNNVQVLANIQSIDTKARTVTIQGATRTVKITAPDDFDMSKLQVGDQVQAEFTDAVAIDIERAPAANK
jgi:hypothetical protein